MYRRKTNSWGSGKSPGSRAPGPSRRLSSQGESLKVRLTSYEVEKNVFYPSDRWVLLHRHGVFRRPC
jgi:hypothetical protein